MEMTNFLRLMTCPTIFFYLDIGYLDSLAFLFSLVYTPNILTCFESFLNFLLSLLIQEKGIQSADIGGP